MNIFDLVSAKNIAQYWIEKNVNAQPLLGETLFPYQKEIGIQLDWIKGAKDRRLCASNCENFYQMPLFSMMGLAAFFWFSVSLLRVCFILLLLQKPMRKHTNLNDT